MPRIEAAIIFLAHIGYKIPVSHPRTNYLDTFKKQHQSQIGVIEVGYYYLIVSLERTTPMSGRKNSSRESSSHLAIQSRTTS